MSEDRDEKAEGYSFSTLYGGAGPIVGSAGLDPETMGQAEVQGTRCKGCGKVDELRLGYCWECASDGEARAAKRTVLQHLGRALRNIFRGSPNYRYDLKWAWERLTRTGDYAKGGYFEDLGLL